MQKNPMYKKRIYLASPLFSIGEQFWNEIVADELRKAGYEVFNPQSDNNANDKDNPNAEVTAKSIFDGDTKEVLKADAIVANLDGLAIDPGLAAECGIMWQLTKSHNLHHKGIIGYRSDIRKNGNGDQRFYFNQYVIGLINNVGEIVDLNPPEDKLNIKCYRKEVKKIINKLNNLFL